MGTGFFPRWPGKSPDPPILRWSWRGTPRAATLPISSEYGDWEISADRATAVRRKLVESGVPSRQVLKVAGFGDTMPMPQHDITDEINRRVTVLAEPAPPRQKPPPCKEKSCLTLLFQ